MKQSLVHLNPHMTLTTRLGLNTLQQYLITNTNTAYNVLLYRFYTELL